VITGSHVILFSHDPDADRAFFAEVLGLPNVDAGGGWLIFKTGPSELGVHPTAGGEPHHAISLMCDDIEATLDDLRAKGAVVTEGIVDAGFGRTAMIAIPGGAGDLQIYQPRHPSAFDLVTS
jgi:predicted enzyme related to lactoylglutathione lyase